MAEEVGKGRESRVPVTRDQNYQLPERLCGGYLVFYHPSLPSPWLYVGLIKVGEVIRVLLRPCLLGGLLPCLPALGTGT